MVPNPRAQARPDRLRPLNARLANASAAEGHPPRSLVINRPTRQVERVQDTWIIEDEWWRQPRRLNHCPESPSAGTP